MFLTIHDMIAIDIRVFSDKVYWQVADQPGKGGPNCLVMGDLVGKEEKRF